MFDDASNAFVFSDKAKGQIQASLKTNTTTTVKTTGKTLTLPMQGQQQGCMGGQFALTMDNMAGFEAGFMYYAPPATEGGSRL